MPRSASGTRGLFFIQAKLMEQGRLDAVPVKQLAFYFGSLQGFIPG